MSELVNQTSSVQVGISSDPLTLSLSIIIPIVTAGALFGALILQRRQLRNLEVQVRASVQQAASSQRQVELIEKDMKQRLRPWLGMESVEPRFVTIQGGAKVSYERYAKEFPDRDLEIVWFIGKIKNYGLLPAHDVRAALIPSDDSFTKDDVKKLELRPYQSLMPQAEGEVNFEISGQRWNQMIEGKPLFVLFHTEYSVGDGEKDAFGYIFKIMGGGAIMQENW